MPYVIGRGGATAGDLESLAVEPTENDLMPAAVEDAIARCV